MLHWIRGPLPLQTASEGEWTYLHQGTKPHAQGTQLKGSRARSKQLSRPKHCLMKGGIAQSRIAHRTLRSTALGHKAAHCASSTDSARGGGEMPCSPPLLLLLRSGCTRRAGCAVVPGPAFMSGMRICCKGGGGSRGGGEVRVTRAA